MNQGLLTLVGTPFFSAEKYYKEEKLSWQISLQSSKRFGVSSGISFTAPFLLVLKQTKQTRNN